MTTETIASTTITNRDATPQVPVSNNKSGRSFSKREVCHVVASTTTGSKYKFFSLPSNAVVTSVEITSPDIGASLTLDIGLYKTTRDGGAVVDADFFKAAVDVHSGALTKSQILLGNVITVANMMKMLWEHLALSVDPVIDYDVVATSAADNDATAGDVVLEIAYKLQ